MTDPAYIGGGPAVAQRGRSRFRHQPLPAVIIAIAVAVVVNIPLVYVFVRAFGNGASAFLSAAFSDQSMRLLANTLLLLAGVLVTVTLIAVPSAWLVTRVKIPGRRTWAVILALPLVFPSYISAFTLVSLLGPNGLVASALGVESLPDVAYGYSGALIAIAFFSYPYLFLPLVGALRGLDPALEESSRVLGKGPWTTFFRVVLPQLRGSIASGLLLVTLYVLSDFGAVSIVRFNTYTVGIYDAYRALFDRTVAAALSSILVALTLLLLFVEYRLGASRHAAGGAAARPATLLHPGRWRSASLVFLGGVTTVSLFIPVTMIAIWLGRAFALRQPIDLMPSVLAQSVAVSGSAAVIAALVAIPIAWWSVRYPSVPSRIVERMSWSGHALPGIVIALALVFFATRFAGPLYQTLALLVAAYVVRFLPEALASVRSRLAVIPPVYEEAARSLGRGPAAVIRTIVFPLLRPGILTGGALVFLTTIKELPATLILRPVGFETLATTIWRATAEAAYSEAAVPAALLLVASGVPLYFILIRNVLGDER
ncbi:MAG: ABC transporter permease [Thermoanaerobaculia bacterium]